MGDNQGYVLRSKGPNGLVRRPLLSELPDMAQLGHLQKLGYTCKIPKYMLESKTFRLIRLCQLVQSEDNQIQYPPLIDKKLDNS